MIAALAVVPATPLLLAENVGRVDPVPELRSAARAAVGSVAAQADRLVVITASDVHPRHSRPPLGARVARELLPREADEVVVVPWDAPVDVCRGLGSEVAAAALDPAARTALVVVADGCATRTEKAPGHLDPRASRMDADWLLALGCDESRGDPGEESPAPMRAWTGEELGPATPIDPRALLALDAGLAGELLFHGRAPLQVLAGALAEDDGSATARGALTAYEVMVGDPFGVRYVVLAAH